jgi:hypothetical protein
MIKKIELLGALRKRDVRFATIASDEAELRAVQEEIDELRSRISAASRDLTAPRSIAPADRPIGSR